MKNGRRLHFLKVRESKFSLKEEFPIIFNEVDISMFFPKKKAPFVPLEKPINVNSESY